MRTLRLMVVRQFIPVFIVTLSFFVVLLQLVDLFQNLFSFLNNGVPVKSIFYISLLYMAKCVSYALPIALLFAVSFTMGNLYANNELIAIFGSGISLHRFVQPLLILGIFLCFFSFFFEDRVVIPTIRKKNSLTMEFLGMIPSFSNTNVTVLGIGGGVIYNLDYYNDESKSMSNVVVITRDKEGQFLSRIDGESARWDPETQRWEFLKVRIFSYDEKKEFVVEVDKSSHSDPLLNEPPSTFRKMTRDIDEMKLSDAKEWIMNLRKAGLSYRDPLTDYYQRFSFALTPLIVAMISCALGGKFKKNILLLSLLSSLIISVVYYVIQMVTALMAKMGYFPPIAGAWTPVLIFLILGTVLFKRAKS